MDFKLRSNDMVRPVRLYQDENKKLYLVIGEEGKAEVVYKQIEKLSLYEFRQLINDIKQNYQVNFGALGIEKVANTQEGEGNLLNNANVSIVSTISLDDNLDTVDYTPVKDFFDNSNNPYNDEYTVTNRKKLVNQYPNQSNQYIDPINTPVDATMPVPNPVDNPLLDPENVDTVEAQTKADTKVDTKTKTK
jgi:SLT domain-containing protein